MRLNGWRRLAVILGAAWFIGSGGLLVSEWVTRKDGVFVHLSLPVGTVVQGATVVLPDGRKIPLHQQLNRTDLKPWEIKWDNEPEVPTVSTVQWGKFAVYGAGFPLVVWAIVEVLVGLFAWVRRGFGSHNAV